MGKTKLKLKKNNDNEIVKELDPICVNMAEQNELDMKDYAHYVLSDRAVVHIWGFKPVHLGILWSMYNDVHCTHSHYKCAKIVGTVIGQYHPHGDTAAYDAMRTLTNWFDCYMPLIDWEGNSGNFQGDGAAHYRYTGAMLTPFCLDAVIGDLTKVKQVVDYQDNYDNSLRYPQFLPIKVPILLINGSLNGIAVGLKTDIPSHNINEVIDATLTLLKNPNARITLKPDECMPCEIVDTNWKAISNTGNGNYIIRAKIDESYMNFGKKGELPVLIIRSLPNQVRLGAIKQRIDELSLTDIPQLLDILEDCTDYELKCILVFKKGTDLNYVKQILYKKTNLQFTRRVNFETYDPVHQRIVRFSYKSYLLFFINFRKETKFRYYYAKYQEISTILHKLSMFIELSENSHIDDIKMVISKNKTMNDHKLIEHLIKKFKLTDIQAEFIINNPLKKFSPIYLAQYKAEFEERSKESDACYQMIVDDNKLTEDIYNELVEIKEKYGCPRRCTIISREFANNIVEGIFKIAISYNGLIRKIPETDPVTSFKGDSIKFLLKANNANNILVFDEMGKSYALPLSKISVYDKKSNGLDIRYILKKLTTNINTVIPQEYIEEMSKQIDIKRYLVIVSRAGLIKKLDLEDFLNVPVSGFFFTKLDAGDSVSDVKVVKDDSDIIVYGGRKAIRFPMSQVPLYKRNTKGVISLKNSVVDGLSIISRETTSVVVITTNGYCVKLDPTVIPRSNKGRCGDNVIKLKKNDTIKSILATNEKDTLVILTKNGKQYFDVSDIQLGSSISTGDKIVKDIVLNCYIKTDLD